VVTVATSDEGSPQRLALIHVPAHNRDEIERIAKAHLARLGRACCFAAVTKVGCLHEPVVVSQTLTGRSETLICFRWVNIVSET